METCCRACSRSPATCAAVRPDVRLRYESGAWPAVLLLLPNGYPILSQAQTRDLDLAKPIRTTAVTAEAMRFLADEGSVYWSRHADLLLGVGKAMVGGDIPFREAARELDLSGTRRRREAVARRRR